MLPPAEIKVNLSTGKFKAIENERGKSAIWTHFNVVVNADIIKKSDVECSLSLEPINHNGWINYSF